MQACTVARARWHAVGAPRLSEGLGPTRVARCWRRVEGLASCLWRPAPKVLNFVADLGLVPRTLPSLAFVRSLARVWNVFALVRALQQLAEAPVSIGLRQVPGLGFVPGCSMHFESGTTPESVALCVDSRRSLPWLICLFSWGLTFELSGRQWQDARPGPVKMYNVPPARAWWPAVGAPLERGVRPLSRSVAKTRFLCSLDVGSTLSRCG
jgi:hypothetical protein